MLTSGVLVAPAVVAMPTPRFTNRKRSYGRFDYQSSPILMDPVDLWETQHGLCLLNSVAIESCCYANTATGIIRTYDVLRDGKSATTTVKKYRWPTPVEHLRAELEASVTDISNHSEAWRKYIADRLIYKGRETQIAEEWWKPEDFPGRDVSCPIDGVLCETLHGEVEIWGPEL